MTRKEAKELLPIIQAFAEGKQIEIYGGGEWRDLSLENLNFDCKPSYYRIQPESKYRPFKDMEECWQGMLKHEPFGWLLNKQNNLYEFIGKDVSSQLLFKNIFREYTFTDGTPFGVKEE